VDGLPANGSVGAVRATVGPGRRVIQRHAAVLVWVPVILLGALVDGAGRPDALPAEALLAALAAAACVSQGWRQLAEDERLWEAACVREWANLGFSQQQLRAVVLSLGGFRRLHAVYIRPLQQRGAGAPHRQGRRQLPVRLGRDQVQLSLSLFSIGFFQNMPNHPLPKKDKGGDGSDKGGGGQCG
jgi:F-box protein GID2